MKETRWWLSSAFHRMRTPSRLPRLRRRFKPRVEDVLVVRRSRALSHCFGADILGHVCSPLVLVVAVAQMADLPGQIAKARGGRQQGEQFQLFLQQRVI